MANFNDTGTNFNTLTSSGANVGNDPNANDCFYTNSLTAKDHNQHFNTFAFGTETSEYAAISANVANYTKFNSANPPAIEEHCRKRLLGY